MNFFLWLTLAHLQAYNGNLIPENQVQLLSVASRVATMEDINMWNITVIDTLAALMNASDGMWVPSLVSKQNKV